MTRYSSMDALRRTLSPDVAVIDDTAPRPPIALTADTVAEGVDSGHGPTPDYYAAFLADAVGVPLEQADNPLAAKFEHLWRTWNGPELTKEYRFHPHRRWRADYALVDAKVLIELEGGLYGNGRHNRAAGYLADIEKYNAASMLGYVVLRLGTGQVDHQHVTEIIDWIKSGVRA